MKQKIVPVISIIIGLLAGLLTFKYLSDEKEKLEKRRREIEDTAEKVWVTAAKRDIPGGTAIGIDDIIPIEIMRFAVPERVVTKKDYKRLLGRKTLFRITAKTPILWTDIDGGDDHSGLASIIQRDMRAISLSVGGASAVSSMIQPNDRVDVLGTFSFPSKKIPGEMEMVTLTVLQDVTVLATGQTMAKEMSLRSSKRTGYSTVTLETTPREAELLVFAQQIKGRLTLSLRNPSDMSYEEDLPIIDFDHLENKLPELNLYRQRHIRHKAGAK
jgi:pilus assembly protein CpaB